MRIALTIDAENPDRPCGDPIDNALQTLDLLRDRDVKATYFIQGNWARANAPVVQRIVDDGHLIGCHSKWHCIFPHMTDDGILNDLHDSRTTLEAFAPTDDRFRLPGGAGAGDDRIGALLAQVGYRHIHWTAGGNDWEEGIAVEQVVQKAVMEARGESPVAVLLFHSWPDPTRAAVEQVINQFSAEAQFVRIDEVNPDHLPRI